MFHDVDLAAQRPSSHFGNSGSIQMAGHAPRLEGYLTDASNRPYIHSCIETKG